MSDAPRGMSPLLETLAEEAEAEAERIVAGARCRAERILEQAEQQAQGLEAEAEAEGRAEGEREARRRIALARIEARQDVLRLRAAEIERVLAEAGQRLAKRISGPDGAELLAALIASAAEALGERRLRVRVRPADRERVEAGIPGLDAELTLDDEDGAQPGAVVSSPDGRRTVEVTVSGLLGRARDAARRVAAEALFAEEAGE